MVSVYVKQPLYSHVYIMHTQVCTCTSPSFAHYRGETFCKEFFNIVEVWSLVPKDVHMMALTATATKATCQQVCRHLGMVCPYVVAESPNCPDIKYSVKVPTNIEETFAPLVEEIRRLRITMDRVILSHMMTAPVFTCISGIT